MEKTAMKLPREAKYFMGGFLTGFGWFVLVFFLGYFWELTKLGAL
jgi:hypothetical protein